MYVATYDGIVYAFGLKGE
ncbi:MAG: hypothetical protein ACRD6B_01440 [Bryobacteraceae bacterium]